MRWLEGHHRLNGHESEQTLGDSERQGSLQSMGPQRVGYDLVVERQQQSLQFSSAAQSCPIICDPMDCRTPGLPAHHQLAEPTQTHVRPISDAIQPSHPLSSPDPPDFNLSQYQGLLNESVLCIRWPKYWSFSFSINVPNEYSYLISFSEWLKLLAVQGILKSFLHTTVQKNQFLSTQLSL